MALLAGALVAGCVGTAPDDVTESQDQEIQGGKLETGFPAVGRYKTSAGTCSGTLITASLVLTAAHCSGPSPTFQTGTSAANFVSHPVDREIKHPSKDLMLAHLASPILNVPLQPFNPGELPPVNTTCTGVGFGIHLEPDGTTTRGIKRSCIEKIESVDTSTIKVVFVTGIADKGDSGGPLLCNGKIAAVVHGHSDGTFPEHIRETYTTIDVGWLLGQIGFVPAPADYDADGKADIAGKDADGNWYVDRAINGFGQWDVIRSGYGGRTCVPVPADYDADRKADFSVKCPETNADGSVGTWLVDYASSPQDGWNVIRTGYGGRTCVPVPADYDGDRKADFSVKCPETNPDGSVGTWLVDYAASPQTGWDVERTGYGRAACIPVPADYDADGRADFSVKCPENFGTWFVDYASSPQDGWNAIRTGYGNSSMIPVPADYDGDRKADLSVEGFATWFIDFASSPQDGWNQIVTLP
jgi:hypothetical protein